MSALRRGDQTMARLLEDSAKRRPRSARVDGEVEAARSLSPNFNHMCMHMCLQPVIM